MGCFLQRLEKEQGPHEGQLLGIYPLEVWRQLMDATINNIFYKTFKKDRTDSDFIANEVLSKYHVSYPNTNVLYQ